MQEAFFAAVARLPSEHKRIFESVTSVSVADLVDKVLRLSGATLARILDLGAHELGNVYPHPLNAEGLHVLKWLLARDIVDRRREANGWTTHKQYDEFALHGLLTRKLKHWNLNATHVPLTLEEADLIALASGWAHRPFGCHGAELSHGQPTFRSSIAIKGTHEHIFFDDDDQYQLHVDVYMPNVKFMVYTEPTRIETGPFHFVRGSHKATAAKARWLFERTFEHTQLLVHQGQAEGAFRHVNRSAVGGWCTRTRDCLESVYGWQQQDLAERFGFQMPEPLLVDAGTLVVADTSGFHFRGLGLAGTRRTRMGNLAYGCGRHSRNLGSIPNVPRAPVLACANGSHLHRSCLALQPRSAKTEVADTSLAEPAATMAAKACTQRSPKAVAARVQDILRILRNDRRCSGPVGLLRDVPTHRADGKRVARRQCLDSVASTLGWQLTWDAERDRAYHRHSVTPLARSEVLAIGNLSFPAQQFWDAIIFDLFFNGAPPRQRRFFEAGARDGYAESNTLFFEKYLGWTGVLVEPTPMAKCNTSPNRPQATVVHGAFCTPGEDLKISPNTTSGFFLQPHHQLIPPDCPLRSSDWSAPCTSWRGLAATHDLNRVDLWSLDIDSDLQQSKILEQIDWDEFEPVAIVLECKQQLGCETVLQKRGYHTLVLENNQKRTYYGDVLAWKDTCRAWRNHE